MRVKSSAPQLIRVHVYLGTLCRSEVFDKSREFKTNRDELLESFGIGCHLGSNAEMAAEREKYCLKLSNGGLVDSNALLFHDDRVLILPKEDYLRTQQEIK